LSLRCIHNAPIASAENFWKLAETSGETPPAFEILGFDHGTSVKPLADADINSIGFFGECRPLLCLLLYVFLDLM
jgi:hypothetical protein